MHNGLLAGEQIVLMFAMPMQSPDNLSLADQAYRLLEEQLLTLQLVPGELLSEKDLVRRAGFGRTPVREAIQRLAADGLLKVLPRKGLMVTPLLRSDLAAIIEAKKVLKRLLVVKAAERATPDQRQVLKSFAMHAQAVMNDPDDVLRLDRHLDKLLAAACQNKFLVKALIPMQSQCRRLWYMQRQKINILRSAQLMGGLAGAVADQDRVGAIRALDEVIETLQDMVNRLDELS